MNVIKEALKFLLQEHIRHGNTSTHRLNQAEAFLVALESDGLTPAEIEKEVPPAEPSAVTSEWTTQK